MTTMLFELLVIQHYPDSDNAPEPFGTQLFRRPPRPDEEFELKWLDGSYAGIAKCIRYDEVKKEVHVKMISEEYPSKDARMKETILGVLPELERLSKQTIPSVIALRDIIKRLQMVIK